MKISHLIFYSISFILALFAFTTYINYNQWELARKNADYFATSTENVRVTNRFQKNILYMGFGLRGYLMTGDNYFVLTYDSAKAENTAIIKELAGLISPNAAQVEKFNEIEDYYNKWVNQFAEPLRAVKSANLNSEKSEHSPYRTDTALRKQEEINNILRDKFRELLNIEYTNRAKAKQALQDSLEQTNNITFALTLLSFGIGLLIAVILARHVSKQIVKMATVQNTVAEATYSGIKNLLPMLFEGGSEISPKVKEHLEAIKARIHKSHILMEGILTYAGIGKELQPKEEVNVSALVKEVLEELPVKTGLAVSVDIDIPVIQTEKGALTQIFKNIIGNAIKYHNKATGQVKIYSQDHGNYYEFFVEDDGPGIVESFQEKIFDLVQTGQDKTALENTGIGLLIVKKMLDTRKEQIKLTSEPGKGSTFSFTWAKHEWQFKGKNKHLQQAGQEAKKPSA